ncbi:hypothetical protein SERLA73DRAFT_174534 [Serpula lacrymans var. lacrymans S7.3]|uniref:Cytochrome P450 n=2 Tax=Serpula lacrymans var. lacrymans TaxID=341189 RepID=F8PGG0_SERL3|nr:uncharacterized protein SERLADRAFT_456116 [Serpula lacrymans var. lacrymans S7.9]EGO05393.1 hypothetical protein SERLA73DRAFT_174534 [Serpula lacrymans var. lacrymans S7.3]EGO31243.1 hypothetical protein SERLADRAFT_456116 [Serpula lacrymans var. lacrymans S7.9]
MPENISPYAVFTALFLSVAVTKYLKRPNLDSIPTVGPGGVLTSYWGAFKWLLHGREMLQEGYTNYQGRAFKVPDLLSWVVIVSGPKLVDEIRKVPDDHLSALEAFSDVLKPDYTLGRETVHNTYHIPIIRNRLTRDLPARFSDILDEIKTSLNDNLKLSGNKWTSVPAFDTMTRVICQTTNRVYVGLPLCRDPDWIDLASGYTVAVATAATVIGFFPEFMAPVVGRLLSSSGSIRRGMKHLRPVIEERQKNLDKYGSDWDEKPGDLLSMLMDEAKGEERSVEGLTRRILAINMISIQVLSVEFTHALFHLAANPRYIGLLREEIEAIVEEEGWSKGALARMEKVDGFLKESLRLEGIALISMLRKAVKDFTLADGTFIPAGTMIAVATSPTHHDKEIYKNPDVFDPSRFINDKQEGKQASDQMVSTSPSYLAFGHGKNACPGRFFAATELKAMLAHIVTTYDIKFKDEGVRPANVNFSIANLPNEKAHIMFRKRVD